MKKIVFLMSVIAFFGLISCSSPVGPEIDPEPVQNVDKVIFTCNEVEITDGQNGFKLGDYFEAVHVYGNVSNTIMVSEDSELINDGGSVVGFGNVTLTAAGESINITIDNYDSTSPGIEAIKFYSNGVEITDGQGGFKLKDHFTASFVLGGYTYNVDLNDDSYENDGVDIIDGNAVGFGDAHLALGAASINIRINNLEGSKWHYIDSSGATHNLEFTSASNATIDSQNYTYSVIGLSLTMEGNFFENEEISDDRLHHGLPESVTIFTLFNN